MNALIGTGFYAANEEDFLRKFEFFETLWLPRLGNRDIVVVDNIEAPTQKLVGLHSHPNMRVLPVMKNLGHVGSHLGQYRPQILGWSMSWIIPALFAYSEGRDFCYVEQDCLPFGRWEESILEDMEQKQLLAAFGSCEPSIARCEQSIFYIRHEFITEFIWKYLSFGEGDGLKLPETKFAEMSEKDFRIGMFSMGVGRNRTERFQDLVKHTSSFYAQKLTLAEIEELKIAGLL